MDLLSTFLVIILSIGCAQGTFLGLQILFSKPVQAKNRFLGILLLLFSYRLFNEILLYFGIGHYDLWYHLTLELSWAYGALIFLYVKSSVSPNYRFTKREWWLFLPIGIQLVASIFVRAQNFYWDGTRESLSWLGYWGYVLWRNYSSVPFVASLLILIYLQKSWRMLSALDQDTVDQKQFRYFKRLIKNTRYFYLFVVVIYFLDFFWIKLLFQAEYYYFTRFFYNPFLVSISILTYWLSFSGYQQRKLSLLLPHNKPSDLEYKTLEKISQQLESLMEKQQVYTNAELSLDHLAKLLDTKAYLLSNTFKHIYKSTFYQYINQKRAQAFKAELLDPNNEKYALLALAYQAGFNSKSSFHRAIKKEFGLTPSELKKSLSSKGEK